MKLNLSRDPLGGGPDKVITAAIAGGYVVAGCLGAGLTIMVRPPEVVTEVLALSQGCRDTILAGEDYIAADKALDEAVQAREDAKDAAVAALGSGDRGDVEAALEGIDVAQADFLAAEDAYDAAGAAFPGANNRCFTELDAARTQGASRD